MSGRLLLIPTQFERTRLPDGWEADLPTDVTVALCGFGVIASAARTSQLIEQHHPHRVVLLGIAGAYSESAIGRAVQFKQVTCDGVGVGDGDAFQPASALGWTQWPGAAESLQLETTPSLNTEERLLTCCAASDSPQDAACRLQRSGPAFAEDMEGYSVALACHLAEVPCQIVRGISNQAGNRDKSRWRIDDSLKAAADAVAALFDGSD